ncbi:MAG: hypothetical protein Q7S37_05095 [bacterium]|nr:hypothetical protein [bacterium]
MEIQRQEAKPNFQELSPEIETKLGLKLDHQDNRRKIYIITDPEKFLLESGDFAGIGFSYSKIKKLFEKYPNGLKQMFIIEPSNQEMQLGGHYHTPLKSEGTGQEIFLFIDVPTETTIKAEQYQLDQSKGLISYRVKSGDEITNGPYQHHTFTCNGPFTMMQLTEAKTFKDDDLHQFSADDWSQETGRLIPKTEK